MDVFEAEDFPNPPDELPQWAIHEAQEWVGLDEFEILARAEARTGLTLDVKREFLPAEVWGIHLVRKKRGRIFINKRLPDFWQRFALFHELYHLLNHTKGEKFWSETFFAVSSFESQADTFAWAAVKSDWQDKEYYDWGKPDEYEA